MDLQLGFHVFALMFFHANMKIVSEVFILCYFLLLLMWVIEIFLCFCIVCYAFQLKAHIWKCVTLEGPCDISLATLTMMMEE